MKIILAYYDRIRSIILDLTLYKPDHMIRQKQHFRLKIHNLKELMILRYAFPIPGTPCIKNLFISYNSLSYFFALHLILK